MTPEDWQRARQLFHRALELPSTARGAFLDAACADQPVVRTEVESLLSSYDKAGGFLDTPAPEPLQPSGDAWAEGARVGVYEIERELGRGGMGVAYLARDTRLGRPVTIKVLPPRLRDEPTRRARLEREARAAARVAHPGVATIYALEEHGGELAIVSEYVPGRTLREILEGGPMPLADVVDIARQLARALEAAHACGVVHRDLKPENVVRRADGAVKVLDFGLALSTAETSGSSPTRLTIAGTVLGTPAYMAPEQLAGHDVDFRADLYSFGVLVYELASGRHPFERLDEAGQEPQALGAWGVPAASGLDAVLERCFQALPQRRFARTRELVDALDRLLPRGVPGAAVPSASRAWWWRFHQGMVSCVYAAFPVLAWTARPAPDAIGLGLCLTITILASVLAAVRLHLLFVSRFHPESLQSLRAESASWLRYGDSLLALVIAALAIAAASTHLVMAVILLILDAAHIVTAFRIEPATARAAFGTSEG